VKGRRGLLGLKRVSIEIDRDRRSVEVDFSQVVLLQRFNGSSNIFNGGRIIAPHSISFTTNSNTSATNVFVDTRRILRQRKDNIRQTNRQTDTKTDMDR